ncbi:MAG TPA: FAD-binding molybdopterin dehydrogenase, partial [Pseudomonas sp.]|nr:FAD-binding molybdopterin dehydrogenase [Pseudomonas sp.]
SDLIAFADFHRLPGEAPERDNTLVEGELITAVELPAQGFAAHSSYLKVRDRASYAFALVSVAAALDMEGTTVRSARIAMGGVAHKPWRKAEAEAVLVGRPPDEAAFAAAADALLGGASGFEHNAFKIELGRRAIVRALTDAARGAAQ